MNWFIFIFSLLALQVFCLVVGGFLSRGMKTNRDYFLASRTVSFFPLMMTLIATQIGGGLVLGSAQEAYTYGWSVLLYPLGQSLGFILLACGIGKKMAESGASTIAELCERAFGSRKLRQIASLLSMISLFMILVAQVIASKKFMVSVGLSSNALFIAFWIVVIIYTVLGGLKGVIAIDVIQAAFFIGVFLIALSVANLPSVDSFLNSYYQANFYEDPTPKLLGWLIMPLLFMAIEQDMGQRCFAADSPKTVTTASFLSAFLTFSICTIPVFLGVLAKSMAIDIPEGGSVFMTVIQKISSPEITALVACAVIAVIITTAVSLINAISSNLTQDFNWKGMKVGGPIRLAQIFTASIAVGAILFSFAFTNIVGIMIQSYDLSVSCLFVPVMVALLKGKGSSKAAWASFLAGAIAFIFFRAIPYEAPKEILCILISAAAFYLFERAKP